MPISLVLYNDVDDDDEKRKRDFWRARATNNKTGRGTLNDIHTHTNTIFSWLESQLFEIGTQFGRRKVAHSTAAAAGTNHTIQQKTRTQQIKSK